ncbi:MAG TPA: GAF domain-containing protein, partial [Desulfobacteraceae bacterium]|nr:GAF domain-containing protein [Desulfobacteraceae bacterium]
MYSPHSLIHMKDILGSLARFTGSSGIILILYESDRTYAFPEELERNLAGLGKPGNGIGLHEFFTSRKYTRVIGLQSGKLIFIDPSPMMEEPTLQFLGDQLAEKIHILSIFDSLCQASIAISSNLNLKTLLQIVMSLTEDLLGNEVSAVILLKPGKNELYWEVSRGDKSDFFEGDLTLRLGQGIAGNVALTGESVLLNDVHEDPRWDDSFDKKTGFHTRSMICVPIIFHGNILGVIEVINKKRGSFTFQDLKILEIISAHTGPAIE